MGHSGTSITDGYDRVREDVEFRKEVAQSVGTGFVVPAVVVQKVHKTKEKGLAGGTQQAPVLQLLANGCGGQI
jgi:hypothetical protein